jgi:enterochelin esterase family protein
VSRALDEILHAPALDAERVDRFLDGREFPIVEGRSVTFVFRGEADEVRLRHWIFGLPSSQPFQRVASSDLWRLTIDLPRGSRVEYKIEVVRGATREWILDPRNPKLARDPFGANSVAHADGYETPEWTLPDPEARPGAIEELTIPSRAFGDERRVAVYLPARFRRRARYPLVVFHDGSDYMRYASLRTVLDNLTHRLEIPSAIVALTDPRDRMREYGADDRHARWLASELVPILEARYPLIGRPEARGLVGASLGAVAALHAAWSHPGHFGRLLLQSGSFAFSDIGEHRRGHAFDHVVEFVNRLRETPGRFSERLFVTCGIYESLIYENRSIVPLLSGTGMDVQWVEVRDGHNWENWRDRLREGLSWLYPGPLWMVYE